jgi:hypothetical protein
MHFYNEMFESHWFKHAFDFWNYEVEKCVFNKNIFIFNVLKKWMNNIYHVWSIYNFKIFKFET